MIERIENYGQESKAEKIRNFDIDPHHDRLRQIDYLLQYIRGIYTRAETPNDPNIQQPSEDMIIDNLYSDLTEILKDLTARMDELSPSEKEDVQAVHAIIQKLSQIKNP